MDDHHFGYITKLKAKKKKHQLTVHQTHWAFCAILDVFHSKFVFAHVWKHWSGLVLWRPQVMRWTWFSWRLWEVVTAASQPLTSHHFFFKMITQSLSHKSQGMLQSNMAFAWGYPPPSKGNKESLVLKDESTSGVTRVSRNGTKPLLLAFPPSGSLISQLINCSCWAQVSLWSSQSINCSWDQVSR
jgi:hypothetical protein